MFISKGLRTIKSLQIRNLTSREMDKYDTIYYNLLLKISYNPPNKTIEKTNTPWHLVYKDYFPSVESFARASVKSNQEILNFVCELYYDNLSIWKSVIRLDKFMISKAPVDFLPELFKEWELESNSEIMKKLETFIGVDYNIITQYLKHCTDEEKWFFVKYNAKFLIGLKISVQIFMKLVNSCSDDFFVTDMFHDGWFIHKDCLANNSSILCGKSGVRVVSINDMTNYEITVLEIGYKINKCGLEYDDLIIPLQCIREKQKEIIN